MLSSDPDHRADEFDVTLTLTATGEVSSETLEAHADELLECVLAHAADIAHGAGIAVNFETRSLELDFTVLVDSLSEVHSELAEIARRIEQYLNVSLVETRSEAALVAAGC
jgi:hypothetical protein